jgi:hypothetical protein
MYYVGQWGGGGPEAAIIKSRNSMRGFSPMVSSLLLSSFVKVC